MGEDVGIVRGLNEGCGDGFSIGTNVGEVPGLKEGCVDGLGVGLK
jgi:hypothetical protein